MLFAFQANGRLPTASTKWKKRRIATGVPAISLLVAFGITAPLSAQESSDAGMADTTEMNMDDEARALFDAGRIAFNQGRYEAALEYFQRSYEISRRPALLYNIGSAADRLRKDAIALQAFEEFLKLSTDSPLRAQVESRVRVLRETAQETRAKHSTGDERWPILVVPDQRPSHRDSPAPRATKKTVGPWILLGTSSAIAVAGGILVWIGGRDANKVEDAKAGSSWSSVESANQRAPIFSGVGYAAMGLGVAGAVGSLVWLFSNPSSKVQTSLGTHGVRIEGRF